MMVDSRTRLMLARRIGSAHSKKGVATDGIN
jgi:hypothetical protein